jgi:hypothetical protein
VLASCGTHEPAQPSRNFSAMTPTVFLSVCSRVSEFSEATNAKDILAGLALVTKPGLFLKHIDMPRSYSGLIYGHPHQDLPTTSCVAILRMQPMKSVGGLPHDQHNIDLQLEAVPRSHPHGSNVALRRNTSNVDLDDYHHRM